MSDSDKDHTTQSSAHKSSTTPLKKYNAKELN